MKFYSGFALLDDLHFFDEFLKQSDYTVAGFSYGAIKAARYAAESRERIDTLQLFSPAFFQTKKESFKRLQIGGYTKDPEGYIQKFLEGCFAPCTLQPIRTGGDTLDQLDELLSFVWTDALMETIRSKGIRIEVYLGLEDRIIDVEGSRTFFIPYATVTSIKKANHFLQECL